MGPATLVKPAFFCNKQTHVKEGAKFYKLQDGFCRELKTTDNYDYFTNDESEHHEYEFCENLGTTDTCYTMYNIDDHFFQTGCANTAKLTAKWKTDAQI